MPLILILKNGVNFIIQGEKVDPSEWKGKKLKLTKVVNGHDALILPAEVCVIEHIPFDEYQSKMEEIRQKKEEKAGGQQQGRIARPGMMIPRKVS